MSLQISDLIIAGLSLALLAACGGVAGDGSGGTQAAAPGSGTGGTPVDGAGGGAQPAGWPATIACARDGDPAISSCVLEADADDAGTRLIVRHPDGGFRRLDWRAGALPLAADGAESVQAATLAGGQVAVSVANWRYTLPPHPGTP